MGAKELKRHLRQILWKKGPQMVADLRHPRGLGTTDRFGGICEPLKENAELPACTCVCVYTCVHCWQAQFNALIRFLKGSVIQRLRSPAEGADFPEDT